MNILHQNYPLKNLNTFSIECISEYFLAFDNLEILQSALESIPKELPRLILGCGSNILFTQNFKGIVLQSHMKNIQIIDQNSEFVWIKADAGAEWDTLVHWCVENNYAGLENLSYIPGTVGACPVQNIGAYGVEVKSIIEHVHVLNLQSFQTYILSNSACEFDYRNSVFKTRLSENFLITAVVFKLHKRFLPNIEYRDIQNEMIDYSEISLKTIRQAVIAIRKRKLPDPKEIGNAGSFFKNSVISAIQAHDLKEQFPTIPLYIQPNGDYKVASGWLIEHCGWKGFRENDAGVHPNQALVLVNYGNAKGEDILDLAHRMAESVKSKFKIPIEIEVNIH